MANKIKNAPIIGKLFNKISEEFTSFKKFITEQFDKVKNRVVKKGVGGAKPYKGTRNPSSDFQNGKGKSALNNHLGRHGPDLGYYTPEEYLNGARRFLGKNATSTTKSFTSSEGTHFRYDTVTNEFGIMNK